MSLWDWMRGKGKSKEQAAPAAPSPLSLVEGKDRAWMACDPQGKHVCTYRLTRHQDGLLLKSYWDDRPNDEASPIGIARDVDEALDVVVSDIGDKLAKKRLQPDTVFLAELLEAIDRVLPLGFVARSATNILEAYDVDVRTLTPLDLPTAYSWPLPGTPRPAEQRPLLSLAEIKLQIDMRLAPRVMSKDGDVLLAKWSLVYVSSKHEHSEGPQYNLYKSGDRLTLLKLSKGVEETPIMVKSKGQPRTRPEAWQLLVSEENVLLTMARRANLPNPYVTLVCDNMGVRPRPLVALYMMDKYLCQERFVDYREPVVDE